jgi:hypothetical protein
MGSGDPLHTPRALGTAGHLAGTSPLPPPAASEAKGPSPSGVSPRRFLHQRVRSRLMFLVSLLLLGPHNLVLSQAHGEVSLRSSVLFFLAGRRSSASTSTGSSCSCSVCFFPHPPAFYYKCAYTKATRKTEGLDTGAASAAASAAPAAAPTDDALFSLLTGTGPELQQAPTAFEVVPITTYNTRFEALGFQTKSSSTIRSLCSWQCCYYYFCLPPPRPGPAAAGNTATSYVAHPPLYGQTAGPLSTASVQCTTHTSHSVWAIAHTSIGSKLPHTCSTRESAYSLLLN